MAIPIYQDEQSQLKYQIIIGLETHVQVLSKTKAFCACENSYGGIPNSRTCPICLALPGAMPEVNQRLFEAAALCGLTFGSTITMENTFARKSYTYPDLPKGYQITQINAICKGGSIKIKHQGEVKEIALVQLHMEEDVGKNLQIADEQTDYYDYNRAGTPLLEIVSTPTMHSPEEASTYLMTLREIVRFLGISDGEMESGSLRCDANVNLKIETDKGWIATPISEVKNMNSFRALRRAIEFEASRQLALWQTDGITLNDPKAIKTTRRWDDASGTTIFMRNKGVLDDYRFNQEPDIPTVLLNEAWLEQLRQKLEPTPMEYREELIQTFGLTEEDAYTITSSKELLHYYLEAAKGAISPKKVANRLLSELLAVIKEKNISISQSPIKPNQLRELCDLVEQATITGKQSKSVFTQMLATGEDAKDLVQKLDLKQLDDPNTIAQWVQEVLAEFPKAVEDYHQGTDHALKFMLGQLMKKSAGKAKAETARELFLQALGPIKNPRR
ncbi:Asp-tRNA(Asn)/Glu-tRNA(Gln) amidotransferase subunit GatB [Entomospira culicis]|uniref:Aspartyl/glutamyl-tRNA(Asn/Gln) amidotransferase subunit B n=1 Tax=Entomospira culicis TaxID=2719989 RepID=A0A968KUL1_9SPIO|nr:Asp-tRNA(Asn)/Glu-tRNA(Gln) amidotransferase subunit GatB [Entomospira culicis]NIZ19416.1 Asp-tRNA(Asn)/Glu-tRNA(Gln) amidotransferase subunit GatB [Entomospira culicis]NIZ69679.1 Asp-tRNA(Asn)/Glu-tRNA(Gln) amidotransferase subunit GatB [Entomospira culicis]WDI36789.1 Asp-tRNA(Asn)/Glu-tRNA(Gln) amidotransferase subunit GatB [Entomospira culicis]WDI38418.1 Asp-tRNA(Asn)/Glu-tRNA(Gln) amidotransferase subunit GatB [Entomospira culicis]